MLRSGLTSLRPEFQVVDVPSGEEALLIADRQPIDLLVIDVKLPGISGLELMDKIKARQPDLKVILITGLTDHHTRRAVANAGADAFFFKPVELGDLLASIEALIGAQPAPIPEPEPEPPSPGLAERLVALRGELNALAAVLLDGRGQQVAQAGELPGAEGESSLLPALMGVFSAGTRVSHLLGVKAPTNLLYFPGTQHDLFMAHLGLACALVVATPRSPEPMPLEKAIPLMEAGAQDLLRILREMGVSVVAEPSTAAPEPEVERQAAEEEESEGLEAVLLQASEQQLKPEEVDAFWEPSEEAVDTGGLNPDALTYDQAQKLGLTPDEE